MEELIKQAFLHVDIIGPHVQDGHYDLIGPNGEIILPSVWEKVIEPDWAITMHMWPMDKTPMQRGQMPIGAGGDPRVRMPGMPGHGHPQHAGARMPQMHPGVRPSSARPAGHHVVPPPPPLGMPVGGIGGPFAPGTGRPPFPDIVNVDPDREKKRDKRNSKHAPSLAGWLVGKPKPKRCAQTF